LAASFFVSRNDVLRLRRPAFVITSRTTAFPRRIALAVSVHFTPLILIVNLIPSRPRQSAASFILASAPISHDQNIARNYDGGIEKGRATLAGFGFTS
jgi:hypothetical protein